MYQSKFSLADVLALLAALIFGFFTFMGANFLNIGNDKVWGFPHTIGCVIMAVFCTVLLFLTAFGAKLFKRTSRNFKTCLLLEALMLLLFLIFAVIFAMKESPFSHYFRVTSQKDGINIKLQSSITQAEKMFAAYELYAENRIQLYQNTLNRIATPENKNIDSLTEYGINDSNGVPFPAQIDTKIFTIRANLFPTNYSDTVARNGIKEVAAKWLHDAKDATSGWKPIGIVGVVNDIEKNSSNWLNILENLSKVTEKGEKADSFPYSLSFQDVKSNFTQVDSSSLIATGLAILVYVLILLSWLVTKRSTRYPGIKILFGFGKSSANEL